MGLVMTALLALQAVVTVLMLVVLARAVPVAVPAARELVSLADALRTGRNPSCVRSVGRRHGRKP
jgi:hypothetical protein